MAATVCKSPRLLCSSGAAAPCTWPLLRSDRSGAPQGLSAPPKPGQLPPPLACPTGSVARPPPRSYLAAQFAPRRTGVGVGETMLEASELRRRLGGGRGE